MQILAVYIFYFPFFFIFCVCIVCMLWAMNSDDHTKLMCIIILWACTWWCTMRCVRCDVSVPCGCDLFKQW